MPTPRSNLTRRGLRRFALSLSLLLCLGALAAAPAWAEDDEAPQEAPQEPAARDEAAAPAAAGEGAAEGAKADDTAADGSADATADGSAGDGDGDGAADAKADGSAGDGDGDGSAGAGDGDGDGSADAPDAPDAPDESGDADGDGISDAAEAADVDGDGTPDAQETFDPGDPPTDPFDADGDGRVEPEEIALRQEFQAAFADIPDQVDEAALDARPEDAELTPSLTAEKFRELVGLARRVVLDKMAAKIARKSDQRMRSFSYTVFGVSLLGVLLLAVPLVLRRRYPGQGRVLLKYSALAAVTFFVTVNLFGAVLFGLRTAQGALSNLTNPSVAVARGTFDTLERNAEYYLVTGKELFGPTLEQMNKRPEEQPAVLLIENGLEIIEDARVFLTIRDLLKRVDFVFGVLPVILMIVTLVLFVLAIRPTLTEIVKLPAVAASGSGGSVGRVGRDVVERSLLRVRGELLATVCTVGVLSVLTLVSAAVLGRIVGPALEALLFYFGNAVSYLQFVTGASSGLVFVALFGVIFFLALNLATLILSMTFFLGKAQKIFQGRFNDGTPLARHGRFFRWGIPAVLLVQVFPWLFVLAAQAILMKINAGILEGVTDAEAVAWTKLLLLGPLFLVGAYLVAFWAARGLAALKFLATYPVAPPAAGSAAGDPAAPP